MFSVRFSSPNFPDHWASAGWAFTPATENPPLMSRADAGETAGYLLATGATKIEIKKMGEVKVAYLMELL